MDPNARYYSVVRVEESLMPVFSDYPELIVHSAVDNKRVPHVGGGGGAAVGGDIPTRSITPSDEEKTIVYTRFSVDSLQAILIKYELPKSGKKCVLVDRLVKITKSHMIENEFELHREIVRKRKQEVQVRLRELYPRQVYSIKWLPVPIAVPPPPPAPKETEVDAAPFVPPPTPSVPAPLPTTLSTTLPTALSAKRKREDEAEESVKETKVEKVEKEKEDNLCSICIDNPKTMAIIPCGHLCCCKECAEMLTACPICRGPKTMALQIFG